MFTTAVLGCFLVHSPAFCIWIIPLLIQTRNSHFGATWPSLLVKVTSHPGTTCLPPEPTALTSTPNTSYSHLPPDLLHSSLCEILWSEKRAKKWVSPNQFQIHCRLTLSRHLFKASKVTNVMSDGAYFKRERPLKRTSKQTAVVCKPQ